MTSVTLFPGTTRTREDRARRPPPPGASGARGGGAAPASAAARVSLKLAALAYTNLCMGVGSGPGGGATPDLAVASAGLCHAALRYFVALTGGHLAVEVTEDGSARSAQARAMMQVAAIAYASTRHGADACIEFTRAAIGELCQAAARYGALLTGSREVVDRDLHLDDGR